MNLPKVILFLYIQIEVLHSKLNDEARWEVVQSFNKPKSPVQVLTLMSSVGARGVSLDQCCCRVIVATSGIVPNGEGTILAFRGRSCYYGVGLSYMMMSVKYHSWRQRFGTDDPRCQQSRGMSIEEKTSPGDLSHRPRIQQPRTT